MLPLSDGLPARRFPVVNVLLIAANDRPFAGHISLSASPLVQVIPEG